VIVVHGFVAGRAIQASDDAIGRVIAQRQRPRFGMPSQVLVDRLTDERGEGRPPPSRLVLQLAIRGFREAEVRGDQLRHRDIAVSVGRLNVKSPPA